MTFFVTLLIGSFLTLGVPESFALEEEAQVEEADLSLKIDGPSTAISGQTISYTLTVTNKGPNDAENIVAEYFLPSNVSFLRATPELACRLEHSQGLLGCYFENIAAGSKITITTTLALKSNASGIVRNYVNVHSDTDDADPSNDSDSMHTEVIQRPSDANTASNQTLAKTKQFTVPAHVLEAIKLNAKPPEPVAKLEVISLNGGEEISSFPDKIIVRNVGNRTSDNIRVMLSPEISKSFRLSETTIRSIEPSSNVTITLELNGNVNRDTLGNMRGYKGNLMVMAEHHSPIFLPMNIGSEESNNLNSYMDKVVSKAEERYNKLSLVNQILSKQPKVQANYEATTSDGKNVITGPSGSLTIKNLSDKELKNVRIHLSGVGHPFLLEQNVIRSVDPNGQISIKLIPKINSERYSPKTLKGELLIVPSNDKPIQIPFEIIGVEQKDSADEFEVRTASNSAVTKAVDTIIIRNDAERTMDSVKLMLTNGLDRILQLSQDSFTTIQSGEEITVGLSFKSTIGEKKESFMQNYRGELTIVSEHHNKNTIPISIEWKEVSSEHFTVYARTGDEAIADQVVKMLESNYQKLTSRFGTMNTRTVIYITSSVEEMKLINTSGHSYYSYIDDAIFVCSCDDPNYNSLKQFIYRLMINNYTTYHNMNKIMFDKENWLMDGITSYIAVSNSNTGISKKYLETFANETTTFQWYGYGSDAQYGAIHTFLNMLKSKYGDTVIDRVLKYLGSGMISNHRCSTLENCAVLRAVYDMNGLDLDDKRHSLNFDGIVKEWQDYINQNGAEN